MTDLGKLVGAEVRRVRKLRGLTARECAERAGFDRPNWVRLETGRHTPSIALLVRVAVVLRCPLSVLLAPAEVYADDLTRCELAALGAS